MHMNSLHGKLMEAGSMCVKVAKQVTVCRSGGNDRIQDSTPFWWDGVTAITVLDATYQHFR